ncbi:hypothetical protein EUGRSUZ_I01705 [Eucalyptus grandis]|uniref:Uncharacterized protein n=2 Tax=Eucalyptus grandis TaxID=71139 RepID=A0ACC3JIV0_EUCGR|nr:hypothetical protein EUGRSUZ_I01705 [Eucalyptus grandis]
MCPKNCPPPAANMRTRSRSMSRSSSAPGKPKKQTPSSLAAPSRRSRSKTRKPKYLSLGLQISPQTSRTGAAPMNLTYHRRAVRRHRQKHRPSSSPLRPGAHLASGDDAAGSRDQDHHLQDENDVALLFDSAAAADTATLTDLLDPAAPAPAVSGAAAASSGAKEEESAVSSLIRCAMKSSSREWGGSEERWVCYSEVIVEAEKKTEMEEVTSGAADAWRGGRRAHPQGTTMLSLKLDYQEILDAWSDKGSLFVYGGNANHETPQTVPDLMRVDSGPMDVWENVWRVPEKAAESEAAINRDAIAEDGGEFSDKIRQREASVLRYKEKRHSRLFSKRIRYEVRKLNAQKRPRIKGRFVRRDCED